MRLRHDCWRHLVRPGCTDRPDKRRLSLQQLDIDTAIYDESWMGYAARKDSKVETTS